MKCWQLFGRWTLIKLPDLMECMSRRSNVVYPLSQHFSVTFLIFACFLEFILIKFTRVVPIYKKDDTEDVTNYRPISILPAMNKVLETIIQRALVKSRGIHFKKVTEQVTFLW